MTDPRARAAAHIQNCNCRLQAGIGHVADSRCLQAVADAVAQAVKEHEDAAVRLLKQRDEEIARLTKELDYMVQKVECLRVQSDARAEEIPRLRANYERDVRVDPQAYADALTIQQELRATAQEFERQRDEALHPRAGESQPACPNCEEVWPARLAAAKADARHAERQRISNDYHEGMQAGLGTDAAISVALRAAGEGGEQ